MGFDELTISTFKYNIGIFMLYHSHHWLPPGEVSLHRDLNLAGTDRAEGRAVLVSGSGEEAVAYKGLLY